MLSNQRLHYTNTSMQYTAIFHGCKNVNFQMKNYNIFLIFAQNPSFAIYEGRSKSNKTRVTAPFIKSVDKRYVIVVN